MKEMMILGTVLLCLVLATGCATVRKSHEWAKKAALELERAGQWEGRVIDQLVADSATLAEIAPDRVQTPAEDREQIAEVHKLALEVVRFLNWALGNYPEFSFEEAK